MSKLLRNVLSRSQNPAILPIPPVTTGNNVPKSLHKTRRTWHPNVARSDWVLTLPSAFTSEPTKLGESSTSYSLNTPVGAGEGKMKVLRGVKMQMKRRKDVEKAGGIEGLLLSRPSKAFTPFGKQLRSALFEELHRMRKSSIEDQLGRRLENTAADPSSSPSSSSSLPDDARYIHTGSGR